MNDLLGKVRVTTTAIFSSIIMCGMPVAASAQQLSVSVKDAQFTRPLVEKLAAEYSKEHPGVNISVINTDNADGRIELDGNSLSSIGRFVVLPIANSENEILQVKKVQKGLNDKLERRIFVEQDYLEALDAQDEGEKALPGTVYSLTGKRAVTTNLYAKWLNVAPAKIKGKKILGKEENAITAVKQHKDAISFNVANLVYDLGNGNVEQGLSVFNVDLDGNGKISDAERQAIGNLSSLTAYLDQSAQSGIPTGNVSIETSNDNLLQFVNWARQEGQNYLHQQGFLKTAQTLTAQR